MDKKDATTVQHKDAERRGVGKTAHGVAYMRGLENSVPNPFYIDQYATLLGGEAGISFINSFEDIKKPYGLIDGIAVRTRKIDEALIDAVTAGFRQICVLGAGLDTRPWRIANHRDADINYFEVDFAELFDYKLPILENAGAKANFNYHAVVTDLSLPSWSSSLVNFGFDTSKPTFWILEGLTGYLTEQEAKELFETITTKLSSSGSRLLATFLTPGVKIKINLHRYCPENPLSVLESHGWFGKQEEITETAKAYGRPIRDSCMDGYYIVTVTKA